MSRKLASGAYYLVAVRLAQDHQRRDFAGRVRALGRGRKVDDAVPNYRGASPFSLPGCVWRSDDWKQATLSAMCLDADFIEVRWLLEGWGVPDSLP